MKHRKLYDIIENVSFSICKGRENIKSRDREQSIQLFIITRHLLSEGRKYMAKNDIKNGDGWYSIYAFQLAQYHRIRKEHLNTFGAGFMPFK